MLYTCLEEVGTEIVLAETFVAIFGGGVLVWGEVLLCIRLMSERDVDGETKREEEERKTEKKKGE